MHVYLLVITKSESKMRRTTQSYIWLGLWKDKEGGLRGCWSWMSLFTNEGKKLLLLDLNVLGPTTKTLCYASQLNNNQDTITATRVGLIL